MGNFNIIPGAASTGQIRVLVVARGAAAEPVVRARAVGVANVGVAVDTPPVSARLAQAMNDERVIARRVVVTLAPPPPNGARVSIEVAIDGALQVVELSTLPAALPPDGISFVVASCYFSGFKHGAMLNAALRTRLGELPPLFQLWIGDNLYMDVPGFGVFAGDHPYRQTLDRYLSYFLQGSYPTARALHPNFTTYDDHELWNDYPESQVWLPRSRGAERDHYVAAALECIDLFQASINPPAASANGRSFRIDFSQVSFFVADTRTRRERADQHAGPSPKMMTDEDLQALVAWAQALDRPGVLVLGQPLWMEPVDFAVGIKADHNPPFFRLQYEAIWRAIRAASYDILVVSGDIHYSRFMKLTMQNADNRQVFELVTSPAAEIPTSLSTVGGLLGFGQSQDESSCKAPGAVPGSAQQLKAEYLFATSASNSFALVTLKPGAARSVGVGASFVDYVPTPRFAKAQKLSGVPKWKSTRDYEQCNEPRICVLRER
jgi:hypothetical protein